MTSTSLRLAAAGIAALLGITLNAAPSAAGTAPSPSTAETGELVPFHAGHDHGDSKAGQEPKKTKKAEKSGKKAKGKGKGNRKGKHAGHKH